MATCVSCQDKFERKYMLEGRNNVLYCTECFKRLFLTASGDSSSKHAGDLKDKMFPYPEILSYHKRQSSPTKSSSSTISLSKRPLQCPKADCNKFVSLFTLESHFKYEHKEIPIVLTQLDARSALEFYPQHIRYGITQCIVLLNVINHDFSDILPRTSCYCSKTNLQSSEVRPVMVLLAGRIAACHMNQTDGSNFHLNSDDDDQANDEDNDTVVTSRTYVESRPHILAKDDKIVIWVASNVTTNLSYTVAASTLSNKIRQKFFGPILALGVGPVETCKAGTALILTHYHVNGMTENGAKPLAVDVVIHSPD